MRFGVWGLALLVAVGPSIPKLVGACLILPRYNGNFGEPPWTPDDKTPPTLIDVTYHVEGLGIGCCNSGPCGSNDAHLFLVPTTTDDQTPPGFITYHLEFIAGTAPTRLAEAVNNQASHVRVFDDGMIGIAIDPDDDNFTFDLRVTAFDLRGNSSEPIVLTIEL